MRPLLWIAAALAWLLVVTNSARMGPLPAAGFTVLCAVFLAASISYQVSIEGIMGASIGALVAELLGAATSPLIIAIATAGVFFERTLRIRTRRARVLHVALSAISGTVAVFVARSHSGATWPLNASALAFGIVVLAAPFLIEADDAMAARLAWAARVIGGNTGARLEQAAQLRRQSVHVPLDLSTRRTEVAAWQSLARVAEARVRLSATHRVPFAVRIVERIDSDLERYVVSLARLFSAAFAVRAMRDVAGDIAFDNVQVAGSALEEVQRVLVSDDDLEKSNGSASTS